jgi:predicted component of type VI protein secretion system
MEAHDMLRLVRKPRVHISYKVETEDGVIEQSLPFVVGVIGDFSGDPATPPLPVKDRKFIQIDRDNLPGVMTRLAPGLKATETRGLAPTAESLALRRGEPPSIGPDANRRPHWRVLRLYTPTIHLQVLGRNDVPLL